MATQTVEHIVTYTDSGTATYYDKYINLGNINGVSFTDGYAVFLLEVTILAHGAGSTSLSMSQVHRRTLTFESRPSDGNLYNIYNALGGEGVSNADYAVKQALGGTIAINYLIGGGNLVVLRFSPSLYGSNQIYFRAIVKIVAYKSA